MPKHGPCLLHPRDEGSAQPTGGTRPSMRGHPAGGWWWLRPCPAVVALATKARTGSHVAPHLGGWKPRRHGERPLPQAQRG